MLHSLCRFALSQGLEAGGAVRREAQRLSFLGAMLQLWAPFEHFEIHADEVHAGKIEQVLCHVPSQQTHWLPDDKAL